MKKGWGGGFVCPARLHTRLVSLPRNSCPEGERDVRTASAEAARLVMLTSEFVAGSGYM